MHGKKGWKKGLLGNPNFCGSKFLTRAQRARWDITGFFPAHNSSSTLPHVIRSKAHPKKNKAALSWMEKKMIEK
jgi:hypothetical protein